MKPASLLAVLVLFLVAVVHLARLVLGTEVTVGGSVVPMWVSFPGFLVAGGLAVALWLEARSSST